MSATNAITKPTIISKIHMIIFVYMLPECYQGRLVHKIILIAIIAPPPSPPADSHSRHRAWEDPSYNSLRTSSQRITN